jgi:hypothetical protein
MPSFFISYSRRDRPFMQQFIPRLRNVYGHNNVWYDKDLQGGDKWAAEIQRNITKSDIFVILLTPESMQSQHCRDEWQQALHENKAILPVLLQDNTPIAPELASIQYVDMSAGISDENIDKFHAAVNQLKPTQFIPVATPTTYKLPINKPKNSSQLPRIYWMALPLIIVLVGMVAFVTLQNANSAIAPTPETTTPVLTTTSLSTTPDPPLVSASNTPLIPATNTPIVSATTTPIPLVPTATLPVLPTRPGGVSSAAALNVIRNQGGVAFCNVNPAAFSLANFSVLFAIGAGEVYALADEFPGVAAIAPGTCLCLRNRDIPGTFPQQCSDTNSSSTKRSAGDWFNAQMTLTFEAQTCVLSGGETEKRCF